MLTVTAEEAEENALKMKIEIMPLISLAFQPGNLYSSWQILLPLEIFTDYLLVLGYIRSCQLIRRTSQHITMTKKYARQCTQRMESCGHYFLMLPTQMVLLQG